MFSIQPRSLPGDALLNTYRANGAYSDCYATDIDGAVSHKQFVTAFYTTALFKLERMILNWAVSRPSSDAQAGRLASGATDAFAAWHVEKRCENQLLIVGLSWAHKSLADGRSVENGQRPSNAFVLWVSSRSGRKRQNRQAHTWTGFPCFAGFSQDLLEGTAARRQVSTECTTNEYATRQRG